jgi:hypothetical protein
MDNLFERALRTNSSCAARRRQSTTDANIALHRICQRSQPSHDAKNPTLARAPPHSTRTFLTRRGESPVALRLSPAATVAAQTTQLAKKKKKKKDEDAGLRR